MHITRSFITAIALITILIGALLIVFKPQNLENQNSTAEQKQQNKKAEDLSVGDFINQTSGVRCEIIDDEKTTIAYIKSGSVRADSDDDNSSIIFRHNDKKFYAWDNQKKQGVAMDVPDESLDDIGGKMGKEDYGVDDLIDELEDNNKLCQNASVPDSVFNPPSDVNFFNVSEMIQNKGLYDK